MKKFVSYYFANDPRAMTLWENINLPVSLQIEAIIKKLGDAGSLDDLSGIQVREVKDPGINSHSLKE